MSLSSTGRRLLPRATLTPLLTRAGVRPRALPSLGAMGSMGRHHDRHPLLHNYGHAYFSSTPDWGGDLTSKPATGKTAAPKRRSRREISQAREEATTMDFATVSTALLTRLEAGVQDMKILNTPFHVTVKESLEFSIDMGPEKGQLILTLDHYNKQAMLMSPVSSVNKYEYDAEQQRWVSIESDRHDLIGIITRDLIRICTGCPNF